MRTAFTLIQQLAPFVRDYLLPAPASSLTGALTKEMRYETGYGLQNGVLLHLQDQLHIPGTTSSGLRESLPAFIHSTAGLRENRPGAQGSDRYAQVSRTRIENNAESNNKSDPRSRW